MKRSKREREKLLQIYFMSSSFVWVCVWVYMCVCMNVYVSGCVMCDTYSYLTITKTKLNTHHCFHVYSHPNSHDYPNIRHLIRSVSHPNTSSTDQPSSSIPIHSHHPTHFLILWLMMFFVRMYHTHSLYSNDMAFIIRTKNDNQT